jgi:hypothetical protein
MKTLKAAMATIFISSFAVMTVIHLNMVKTEPAPYTTLDMLKVMAEALDEGGFPPCPVFSCGTTYGGYETTGIRRGESSNSWAVFFGLDGAAQFLLFGDEQAANDYNNLSLNGEGSVRKEDFQEYYCDPGSTQLCWVCNKYPLNGPGGEV